MDNGEFKYQNYKFKKKGTQISQITWELFHVLGVAGIDHDNGVSLNDVGEVPLFGVGHVVACPSGYGR